MGELWESNILGALKGSSQKTNNSPPPGKGVTVNRQGAPGGCSLATRGQNGGCGREGKCKCTYGCAVETNLRWKRMTCLKGNYEDCTDDNYCSYCERTPETDNYWPGKCIHRCFCDYNGVKDHKEEEESLKLMEGDGRFKGREANSYNGERGHKKEEGNSKPVEEDGRFEGGEDGNYIKDEDQKKEESNPKPVEDGDETASK